jgi:3-methylfumaryl-CoA hydratase
MWAGGRIAMLQPIVIGSTLRRRSSVLRIEHKQGRRGDLVFVTVLHEIHTTEGEGVLREEHDIVYTPGTSCRPDASRPPQHAIVPASARSGPVVMPDAVMLFRYSALTFNGHRIHYDVDYCRDVEGYPSLVIHGPLSATLLANHAEAVSGRCLARFDYRLLAPAFLGATLAVSAAAEGGRIALAMQRDDGALCAEAMAVPMTEAA